jgi:hypothetical protein
MAPPCHIIGRASLLASRIPRNGQFSDRTSNRFRLHELGV